MGETTNNYNKTSNCYIALYIFDLILHRVARIALLFTTLLMIVYVTAVSFLLIQFQTELTN